MKNLNFIRSRATVLGVAVHYGISLIGNDRALIGEFTVRQKKFELYINTSANRFKCTFDGLISRRKIEGDALNFIALYENCSFTRAASKATKIFKIDLSK